MGKSLNLIKEELKDEVKEESNYKIKRVVLTAIPLMLGNAIYEIKDI